MRENSSEPIDTLDIVWRNDEQVRGDRHLPGFELQSHPKPPLTGASPTGLVAWAARHEPVEVAPIADGREFFGREYSWQSAASWQSAKPQVHVTRHDSFPLLSTSTWPEAIQWPTRWNGPDFSLLPTSVETPKNAIGLRWGG